MGAEVAAREALCCGGMLGSGFYTAKRMGWWGGRGARLFSAVL